MTSWHHHLEPLDQGPQTWTSRERVEQVLAGEEVQLATATTVKDVCDDGHVHTDVNIGLLTPTRLLHVVAGDAQHVTDEHELGLQCSVTSVPLSAITDVAVLSWDQQGTPAVEIRVSRTGAAWQAMGDVHDCGDPECDIPPGSIQLEGRADGVVLFATDEQASELLRFAGHLSRAAGPR
ncbi:MAG: hypothetical protein EA340_02080 [Nitriliruptor sp.]|nr:MAG: hypothetical protein EA340_02080 [Nitriliruptor sp.]